MAGELVVVGEMLEPLLLRLALGDGAQHAEHPLRPAGVVELGGAALVQPGEAAVGETHAILDVERRAARVMGLEALLPNAADRRD